MKLKDMRVVKQVEACGVCQKPIYTVMDFDYVDADGVCRAVKYERAYLCDQADDSGCFRPYHEHCFEFHSCPVHQPKKS